MQSARVRWKRLRRDDGRGTIEYSKRPLALPEEQRWHLLRRNSGDRDKNDKYDPPEGEHVAMIAQMKPARSI